MKLLAKEFFRSSSQPVVVEQRRPQPPFPLHDHDFYEIVIVLSGNGWHVLNDEPHFITCGEVFYIKADDNHSYEQVNDLYLSNILYRPDGGGRQDVMKIMLDDAANGSARRHWQVTEDVLAKITPLIETLESEACNPDPMSEMMAEALFNQLAVLLARARFAGDGDALPSTVRLGHVLSYLRHNCTEQVDFEELARRFGYSLRNFNRLFREATATTPHDYLVKLRLSRAMRALLSTSDSITDVALASGFNDSNYFSYSFSRATGMSPSEYRRRIGAGIA
ncbi:helix-turn-helix domain-containing protein [Consotaella aegiceratis]|uniref:helix-turn-helix domain-containing protein n=1 Tax=Consotaella aegiceratis TaxID=3097961 RepID=UPI002F3E3BBF